MANQKRVRTVTLVIQQPDNHKSKARLFAFGYLSVALLSKRSIFTVKRHERAGRFSMNDLRSVMDYVCEEN